MHKIQIKVFKILIAISICIQFPLSLNAQNQDLNESLQIADSLFAVRQYTQALQIYEAIFETAEMQSPSMLLKMAYIHEGLNKIPDAMYYLNLYYLDTNDEATLQKMNQLAGKNGLRGYDIGGYEVIVRYYHVFFDQIIMAVAALSLLFLIWLGYFRLIKKKFSINPAIGLMVSCGILFYLINFGQTSNLGIIESSNSYLMSGPSSSSDVIEIVDAGHRVKIIDHNDVWLKIKWDGKTAYTKEKNIRRISLL